MKFGFLLDSKPFKFKGFSVNPLSNLAEIKNNFYKDAVVSHGWVYGPKKYLAHTIQESHQFKLPPPIINESFFGLYPTHEITHESNNEKYLKFMILGYSLLQGLYLTPEGMVYPTFKVPYITGELTGLLLINNDHSKGMSYISEFYEKSSTKQIELMRACIHLFLASQIKDYSSWEFFDNQYKVIDCLYRIVFASEKTQCHADRPIKIAEKFMIQLPSWVTKVAKKESVLSNIRNSLSHEALFIDEPVFFRSLQINKFEIRNFVLKLIIGSLGIKTPFLTAPCNNINTMAWDIV